MKDAVLSLMLAPSVEKRRRAEHIKAHLQPSVAAAPRAVISAYSGRPNPASQTHTRLGAM